ncbi:MAG: AAA family ATPase [Clostridiales bacterium]|jgi:ATP-dependent Clp protease ATP-binding subunit ClpA|nr:AAA family ATPase [Clostridiales bacterium]
MTTESILEQVYIVASNEAHIQMHEYILPEHFLYASMLFAEGKDLLVQSGANPQGIIADLGVFFEELVPKKKSDPPVQSLGLVQLLAIAEQSVLGAGKDELSLGDLIASIFQLRHSYALFIMQKNGADRLLLLKAVAENSHKHKLSQKDKDKEKDKEAEVLQKYTVNLTRMAKDGKLDPLVGRGDIMQKAIMVLCRRLKNNPVLTGDSGVGKTAIVEGLAQKIAKNNVPQAIKNATLFYINMSSLLAGTKYRGDFEERLLAVLEEISKYRAPIIYLDEIHNIVGAGAVSGGSMDATGILKPYLSKGEIRFIGSTTFEDYKKHFEKDKSLTRRFLKIDVPEPTLEENIEILMGIKSKYEKYHNVSYSEGIIKLICELAVKFLKDRAMPDKAIDILDETGAAVRMKSSAKTQIVITKKDIEHSVAGMANVPENTISAKETDNLRNLDIRLKKQIFGQDKAVSCITDAIRLSRSGLIEGERPVANLLFVGPTGVGKTEIAKALARELGVKLVRYDMSEYQEKHSVARLIGSPPGYVGFEEGGLLTDSIRKTPHCVLLLDEIEKAHPDILNILLQVMDYGTLTDNTGKKADFRNVIIIMTSNAGAREIGKKTVGFESKTITKDAVDKEVERVFSPEFRNRLDQTVVFNHVNKVMAKQIAEKAFNELNTLLGKKGLTLCVSDSVFAYIIEKGLSDKYGAREIIRIINSDIKKLLAGRILFDSFAENKVSLDVVDGEIAVL